MNPLGLSELEQLVLRVTAEAERKEHRLASFTTDKNRAAARKLDELGLVYAILAEKGVTLCAMREPGRKAAAALEEART